MKGNNQYINSWTEEEIKILRDNYEELSNKELHILIPNREQTSICWKLKNLGMIRTKEILHKIKSRIMGGEKNPFWNKKHSDETKKHLSDIRVGKHFSPKTEFKKNMKISESHKEKLREMFTGRKLTDEWKEKISKSLIGHRVSQITGEKISKTKKRLFAEGILINPMIGKKRLDLSKRNKDPEYQKICRKYTRPNKPEKILKEIIENNNLSFNYVGDGKIWFRGENHSFNPDFLSKNPKHIIEVFGDYWHNLPKIKERDTERLLTYSKYGYKTLIIWEHELLPRWKKNLTEQEIVNKIKDFIK